MHRRLILACGLLLAALAVAAYAAPASAQAQDGAVFRVPVTGVIEMGLAPFIERSLREAAAAGAVAVVLDIETPGGRVDAAQRIANALADADVPTFAYVNRHAYSAGAMIALATDGIFMRPGSVMGAATPIIGTGQKASEKIVSAMRSQMRALAETRGLDPNIAEAMVDEDIAVEGVVEEGKLLTLTTEEALAVGYAELTEDLDALLEAIGAPGAPIQDMSVNWAERVVRFFSHPVVAPFLLSLGFLGLIVEVKSPGIGIGGAAGVMALSLYFGSHLIVGLAGWEDLMVFGVGLVLVAVEAFIIPGFGIFGILGAIAILGGLVLTMVGSFPTMPDFTQAGLVLTGSMLIVMVTSWALLRHLPNSSLLARRGIFLRAATSRETGYLSADVRSDLEGIEGTAITDLRPSGVGLFGDERMDVVSESEWIENGTPIRIVSSEGYRHVVRTVHHDA